MFPDVGPLTCPHSSAFPSCASSAALYALPNQLAVQIMNCSLPSKDCGVSIPLDLPLQSAVTWSKNISSSILNHRIYMESCIVSWLDLELQYAVHVDCCSLEDFDARWLDAFELMFPFTARAYCEKELEVTEFYIVLALLKMNPYGSGSLCVCVCARTLFWVPIYFLFIEGIIY